MRDKLDSVLPGDYERLKLPTVLLSQPWLLLMSAELARVCQQLHKLKGGRSAWREDPSGSSSSSDGGSSSSGGGTGTGTGSSTSSSGGSGTSTNSSSRSGGSSSGGGGTSTNSSSRSGGSSASRASKQLMRLKVPQYHNQLLAALKLRPLEGLGPSLFKISMNDAVPWVVNVLQLTVHCRGLL
jgi:hypothetical protein